MTGTGKLRLTVHSDNQTVLPDSSISGASICTAAGTCILTLNPTEGQPGSATVTATVSDASGQRDSGTFAVTVAAASSGRSSPAGGSGSSSGGGGALALWVVLTLAGLTPLRNAKKRPATDDARRHRPLVP